MNCHLFVCLYLLISLSACQQDVPEFASVPTSNPANITKIQLQTATSFVNADTSGRLLVTCRVYDRKAQLWYDYHPANKIELYADGVLQKDEKFFATTQPGITSLQMRAANMVSEPVSITARPAQSHDLVRLPVIFHFPVGVNTAAFPLPSILKRVNDMYRNRVGTTDPNQADSFIEFYLAEKDPGGKLLARPGMNPLSFSDQTTDSASAIKVDSVLRQWCVKSYINVFVQINWLRSMYAIGYSYVSTPGMYTGRPPGADFECSTYKSRYSGLAIMIANETPSTLAHELGHYLSLPHTFDVGCQSRGTNYPILDTPLHTEDHPVGSQKRACRGALFVATNVMDYFITRANFTQDQVRSMRRLVSNPTYLPLPVKLSATNGRLVASPPTPEIGCRPSL